MDVLAQDTVYEDTLQGVNIEAGNAPPLENVDAVEREDIKRWAQDIQPLEIDSSVTVRRLCPRHTPKAVTYHEQSHYCRFMIGHSLGRMDISYFLTTFPFI